MVLPSKVFIVSCTGKTCSGLVVAVAVAVVVNAVGVVAEDAGEIGIDDVDVVDMVLEQFFSRK